MAESTQQTSFFIDPTLLPVVIAIVTLLFGIYMFSRKRPILKYEITSSTFRKLSADDIGEDAEKFGAEGIFTYIDIGIVVDNVGDRPSTIKRAEASFQGATGHDDTVNDIAAHESRSFAVSIPFWKSRVDADELIFDLTIEHTHGVDLLTHLVAKKSERSKY